MFTFRKTREEVTGEKERETNYGSYERGLFALKPYSEQNFKMVKT